MFDLYIYIYICIYIPLGERPDCEVAPLSSGYDLGEDTATNHYAEGEGWYPSGQGHITPWPVCFASPASQSSPWQNNYLKPQGRRRAVCNPALGILVSFASHPEVRPLQGDSRHARPQVPRPSADHNFIRSLSLLTRGVPEQVHTRHMRLGTR